MSNAPFVIPVGARTSPLSQIQVQEVLNELNEHYPHVTFDMRLAVTTGDKDQKTSLRTLDKTDFFTKEIDKMLLKGECRIGIHSAKDLPDPLPAGLRVIALTKGVDSSDALVLQDNMTLETLPPQARIGTSSLRREETVRNLRADLRFPDIRGTIGQRLEKLFKGEMEGIVIAEAALIRLGLTHLNRILLPGPSTPYQGQLAVLARSDDDEIEKLFACIDCRKSVLYLGLDAPQVPLDKKLVHCPVIKIIPRPPQQAEIASAFKKIASYTHFIFTSKSAVRIFFEYLNDYGQNLGNQCVIAVGKGTASFLRQYGVDAAIIAAEESAEGIVKELEKLNLKKAHVFWPHAALARSVLGDYLKGKVLSFDEVIVYDTHPNWPAQKIDISKIDEIIFTSPSTIDAYIEVFGPLPDDKLLTCIGPITKQALLQKNALSSKI